MSTTPRPFSPKIDRNYPAPRLKLPPGACDCHFHFVGPQQQFALKPWQPMLVSLDWGYGWAKGATVYKRCAACHVVDKEQNRVGPYLMGVVGRPAGGVESYKYSDAMKNSGFTWDEATLDKYLADPKAAIPGNKMAFPGLKNEQERADVIAFLAQGH